MGGPLFNSKIKIQNTSCRGGHPIMENRAGFATPGGIMRPIDGA
jgi:hypothetical protein